MSELFVPVDAWDRRFVRAAGALERFNRVGLLEAADVHVARRVGALAGETDEAALLALAMVVRAVRHGSVCLELGAVGESPEGLAWPQDWAERVRASALMAAGVLRMDADLLYLDRYWQEEGQVVADLRAREATAPPEFDEARLVAGLDRLFAGDNSAEQRAAAEASVRRWTSVITGGPGTGKTTTLARLLALLQDTAPRPLRIGLAAPTGKAAAQMTEAIAGNSQSADFPEFDRAAVAGLQAATLHRLLGWRRDNGTRFRHHRHNRLPHDVVVVDETSMVSLTQMARLIEAVRPDARLILLGDPDQLTSVEAGAVLKDLVRGFGEDPGTPVSRLTRTFRFGDRIEELAAAIRDADADAAWALLQSDGDGVELIDPEDLPRIRSAVQPTALALLRAAEAGNAGEAAELLRAHRLLCAHREGPTGVAQWNRQIERWLLEATGRDWFGQWYAGQPLIVNANDYGLRLWNGDTGVVTRSGGGLSAVFPDGVGSRSLSLTRLSDVDTAHAMTVHRSQGSQFAQVSVLLPEVDSPTLTRELLYTAVTRARDLVRVIGTEESFRAAIARPAQRATGLAGRIGG